MVAMELVMCQTIKDQARNKTYDVAFIHCYTCNSDSYPKLEGWEAPYKNTQVKVHKYYCGYESCNKFSNLKVLFWDTRSKTVFSEGSILLRTADGRKDPSENWRDTARLKNDLAKVVIVYVLISPLIYNSNLFICLKRKYFVCALNG